MTNPYIRTNHEAGPVVTMTSPVECVPTTLRCDCRIPQRENNASKATGHRVRGIQTHSMSAQASCVASVTYKAVLVEGQAGRWGRSCAIVSPIPDKCTL